MAIEKDVDKIWKNWKDDGLLFTIPPQREYLIIIRAIYGYRKIILIRDKGEPAFHLFYFYQDNERDVNFPILEL